MGKDTRLVNIYLKIHNKRAITMDDLAYLAQYAPECFEKTCKNIVYKIPETKAIMEPPVLEEQKEVQKPEISERQNIEKILENLKHLETNHIPINDIDVNEVKNLLGNLYMELLFPHNDTDTFMNMVSGGNKYLFDKKV